MKIIIYLVIFFPFFFTNSVALNNRGIKIKLRASEFVNSPVVGEVQLYQNSYALVVGIDNYNGGWPKLSGAVNDSKLIAEELRQKGFDVTLKTNLNSSGLEKTFKEFFILKGEKPQARLFVWFAGHGHTLDKEGFLIPADAPKPDRGALFKLKALSMRRFGELVRLAKSKHAFVVFDSCFSGTIFTAQRSIPPAAITRATTLPVRQFLASGDANQEVSDDGTFRKLFIRALRGEERADANTDGYLTANELGMFLTDRLTNLTNSIQTPRYGKLRDPDFDRGDFVFVLPHLQTLSGNTDIKTKTSPSIDKEILFWQAIKDSTNPSSFEAYLSQFPNGTFTSLARIKLDELKQNNKMAIVVKESKSKNDLYLNAKFGIRVGNLTSSLISKFDIPNKYATAGVVIVDIERDSKGEKAGFKLGDVIKEISHNTISSEINYYRLLRKLDQSGKSFQFFLYRPKSGFLVVKPE